MGQRAKSAAISPGQQATLRRLLEITGNRAALSVLLEAAGCRPVHSRYMGGPIIVYQTLGGATGLPEWLIEHIQMSRLAQILAELEQGIVGELSTPAEVFAYIYPASTEFPLGRAWTNIYLWLAGQVFEECGRLTEKEFRKLLSLPVGAVQPTPDQYERNLYQGLSRRIRAEVVQVAAERERRCPRPAAGERWRKIGLPPPDVGVSFEQCFRRPGF